MNYVEEAAQTKSDQFHGSLVPQALLLETLVDAVRVLEDLDRIKKALFYGKDPSYTWSPGEGNCTDLPVQIVGDHNIGVDLIHGIIGKATEAGEMLEALLNSINDPDSVIDQTNLIEEIGDGQWYDAIMVKALDTSLENVQKINIDKLRARFPNKFTEYDANNRDLGTERKILEGKQPAKIETGLELGALPMVKLPDEAIALLVACNSVLNGLALQNVPIPMRLISDLTVFCRENVGHLVPFDKLAYLHVATGESTAPGDMVAWVTSDLELQANEIHEMGVNLADNHEIDFLVLLERLGLMELQLRRIYQFFGWSPMIAHAAARRALDRKSKH